MTERTCLLCGSDGLGVRIMLAAWKEPVGGRTFEAIPRCADRVACRARVEAIGEAWPLVEGPSPRPEDLRRLARLVGRDR